MRLNRSLRWERRRDAQPDEPVLDLLTQSIEQIRPVVVVAHRSPVKGDSALVAAPAAHGHKGAAVSNRTDGEPALERTIGKTVDPERCDLADLCGDVIPSRNDNIGA